MTFSFLLALALVLLLVTGVLVALLVPKPQANATAAGKSVVAAVLGSLNRPALLLAGAAVLGFGFYLLGGYVWLERQLDSVYTR